MLAEPTPFPCTGSIGFLAKTAEPARILQRCGDGTLLIERQRRTPWGGFERMEGATANRRVAIHEIFAEPDVAIHGSKKAANKARRSRAAGGRS